MLKFKEGKNTEEANEIIRRYLIRCYATISKQYPQIAGMNPEEGVGCLFKLRDEGKIRIALESIGELIDCEISYIN